MATCPYRILESRQFSALPSGGGKNAGISSPFSRNRFYVSSNKIAQEIFLKHQIFDYQIFFNSTAPLLAHIV
jgi:hypothetical protein